MHIKALFLIVAATLLLPERPQAKDDGGPLEGEWKVETFYLEGAKQPEEACNRRVITISKGLLKFVDTELGPQIEFSLKVSADKNPREIDLTERANTIPGIAKTIEGHLFLVIRNRGTGRPTTFLPSEGDGLAIYVLKKKAGAN